MLGSNHIKDSLTVILCVPFTRGSAHVNRLSLDVSSIKFKHQERSCEIQFYNSQLIVFIICKSIQVYAYHILDNIRHPFFSSIHYNMMPPILLPLLLLPATISRTTGYSLSKSSVVTVAIMFFSTSLMH